MSAFHADAKETKPAQEMSLPEHPLHFGPGTSVTSPLRWKGRESGFRAFLLLLTLDTCPQSRPWECGNPKGISKECGKGGKPASWLSRLSIFCHFHGLLWHACSKSEVTENPVFRASVSFGPTRRGAVVRPSHLSIPGVCNISVPGTTRLVGCWSAYPLSRVVGTPRIWSYERPLHSGLDWAGNRWHCPVLEEKNDKLNG
jgi:hypothetical protein